MRMMLRLSLASIVILGITARLTSSSESSHHDAGGDNEVASTDALGDACPASGCCAGGGVGDYQANSEGRVCVRTREQF